jgi:OmcA/MtrC family decaheme c-type cytochrome
MTGPDGTGHYTVTLLGAAIPSTAKMLTCGVGYSYSLSSAFPLTQVNVPGYPYDPATKVGGISVPAPNVWRVANGYTGRRGAQHSGTSTGHIVSTAKCNSCHGDLRGHGGDNFARNVEECAMCHTASLDTSVRQGANHIPGQTTSLRFSTLIHRIHAGSYASDPYSVFGYSPALPYPEIDFSEREYPGDLRDCAKCHTAGSYFLPLAEGALPSRTVTLDDVRWTCELMSRLSDEQWESAFRAGGYDADETARFVRKIKSKIAQGLDITRDRPARMESAQ